jgi:hypothetical protein
LNPSPEPGQCARLLSPLAAAHTHLSGRHNALVQQLGDITEHANRIRRDATDRRHPNH